ncbi:MAG: hypothetical protein QNJ12_08220 [Ilumatobacter sp.]|uniref:hypothetical protein n=1 Tax=Ilumatobacter sp. TaxID=1967498 RepID=UPI002601B7DE|nr:hypothetical protein [Ilumatobacter sp.]MDJ0768765.1 hypothetical protein [Ilumatobacter sp.]
MRARCARDRGLQFRDRRRPRLRVDRHLDRLDHAQHERIGGWLERYRARAVHVDLVELRDIELRDTRLRDIQLGGVDVVDHDTGRISRPHDEPTGHRDDEASRYWLCHHDGHDHIVNASDDW